MRAKWSAPIRKYWKVSEQMMVKYCDLAMHLHDTLRNCGMPAAEKRVRTQIRTVLMLCFVVKCSVPTAAIV